MSRRAVRPAQGGEAADDGLHDAVRERQKQCERYLSIAAKLLAPTVEKDVVSGFDWVSETLRASNQSALATEMAVSKVGHLPRPA